jgi:hypothetical protein
VTDKEDLEDSRDDEEEAEMVVSKGKGYIEGMVELT